MKNLLKNWSLVSRGLRYKLIISFSLMSIIPLLVCLNYVFPFLFPNGIVWAVLKDHADIILLFTFVIAIMGFIVVKRMIDPVIKISSDASRVAGGDLAHKISKISDEDEIGDLSKSLNKITMRIRENMDELRNYGEKTREINFEINKRVVVLSGLLQISELISKEVSLNEILEIIVGKAVQLGSSTLAFLCLKDQITGEFVVKSAYGPKADELRRRGLNKIKIEPAKGFLGKTIKDGKVSILDRRTTLSKDIEDFQNEFSIANCLVLPILSRGETVGVLVIGNKEEDFLYPSSDLELIDIFSKQVGIAIENDFLIHRVRKLEIKDALTGLYNEAFIRNRLDEEIKRAISFQRPCAFILFDVDGFEEYHNRFGNIAAESILKRISVILQESVTDIDKVARFGDSSFALILPEKNKRQCLEVAEEIRKKVEFIFSEEEDVTKRVTLTGAVAENPIDGVTAQDLINKAQQLLADRINDKIKNKILS